MIYEQEKKKVILKWWTVKNEIYDYVEIKKEIIGYLCRCEKSHRENINMDLIAKKEKRKTSNVILC